jgi:oligopeptide transport system substrate-binding protein
VRSPAASIVIAFSLALALGLAAGCSSSSSEDGTATEAAPTSAGETQPADTAPAGTTEAPGESAPAETEPEAPAGPTLRVDLGPDVRVLDPAEATDPAEGSVLLALLEPLVVLDEEGRPAPGLTSRWEVSEDGRIVTFHLRPNGVWTNGDPVTAADFEYAWKRAAAPRFAATNAALFDDITGAAAYTSCNAEEQDCEALRERIAVEALDDVTLEVTLKQPAPWFLQRVAHWAFLPVHEPTIAEYKRRWTLPENIVSNGPFELVTWSRRSAIELWRWDAWRDAGAIDLARIEGSMLNDPSLGLGDFQDGELDACLPGICLPADDRMALAATAEVGIFPAPQTTYLGINTERVPDPRQRKAIAIGLDRLVLAAASAPALVEPATRLIPGGVPSATQPGDDFLEPRAKRGKARRLLGKAEDARTELVLAFAAGDEALAERLQVQLEKIGLQVKLQERKPDNLTNADLFIARADAPDGEALEVLTRWTCGNATGFCDPAYDKLVKRASRTGDDSERLELEAEAEALLTGSKGAFPAVPLSWGTYQALRDPEVEGFDANLLGLVELANVSVPGE